MRASNDNLAPEPAVDMTAVAIAILAAIVLVALPSAAIWLRIVW